MAIKIQHSENVRGALFLGGGESLPVNKELYLRGWDTAEVSVNGETIKDSNGEAKTFPRVIFDYTPLTQKNASTLQIKGDINGYAACIFISTLTRRIIGYEGDDKPIIYTHKGPFMDVINNMPQHVEDFKNGMDAICQALLHVEEDGKAWKIVAHPILKKDKTGKLYPSQYYDLVR